MVRKQQVKKPLTLKEQQRAQLQNRTQPQKYTQKKNSLNARNFYKKENAISATSALDDATSALDDATTALNTAASQGATLVTTTSNLKTLPPLMLIPHVRIANLCLSARDAYHDAHTSGSIQENDLFIIVQKLMFGATWAQTCHATFSRLDPTDNGNGTWLSPPENDIFWQTVRNIKTLEKNTHYSIVPRFLMKLEPYNFDACIRAVTPNAHADPDPDPDPDSDTSRVIFDFIVDNANLRSPSSKPPRRVSTTTNRRVTISEIYDRAGRSYTRERLTKLKEWWVDSVDGADTNTYPDISIPLAYVGEITIPGSVLSISLFQRDVMPDFDTVMLHHKSQATRDREPSSLVQAALLFRFYIPGVTVDGVPGVVNSGTDPQPIYTYNTYVFIHSNGSVTYSREDNANYPDNTEKNTFYTSSRTLTLTDDVSKKKGILYNICKSVGDSCAVWTASVNTFIHTTDTGLILRCMFNDRYCVTSISEAGVTQYYIVSPSIARDLYGVGIPQSPRPILPDQVIAATPRPMPKGRMPTFADLLKKNTPSKKLEAPQLITPRYIYMTRSASQRSINKYNLRPRVGGGSDGIQQGGFEISSDSCRYFQTLLSYMVSFYSNKPGNINNFSLPESKDVVVFFTDEVIKPEDGKVPNPFENSRPGLKFISFTELPFELQKFLTLLKTFVEAFVSNIQIITGISIPPKYQDQEMPSESANSYEKKLNLIRTIISNIPLNEDSADGDGDINKINTDLREVLFACLLPSVLLRIDDPNIKKSYLESYNALNPSKSTDDTNFFYLPNATNNIFDVVDKIVSYFGGVFSNPYDGINFNQLPITSPISDEVKMSVAKVLEQFKQEKKMYTIPTQIKFNTRAVTNAKIFDNLCKIIDGDTSNDKTRMDLQKLIDSQVSAEIQKLNKLPIEKESGEDTPSLSEQINNNIEATARDNILREFMEQMATYFVDGEMEDFEKESMKALIDLDATYGFKVNGNDFLHLNDIVYKIFVQEIMYTGAHIQRVDFLQDFISNIGFNTEELMYMDNINDALEASGSISNEKLTELKIKGYSLSEIIGLLYELRDKTTESTSDEDVTSIINGFLNQEVSSVPKPTQPIQQQIFNPTPLLPQDTRALVSPVGTGGKPKRISNPKQNTKYRKKYKKFVSKYIIKKNKNNKKKNNKNNKNKTRKNKRLTKSKPNSKRNNKTLKNKKHKSKPNKNKSNHKSKYNKKAKTNYYNLYKHKKTLKH